MKKPERDSGWMIRSPEVVIGIGAASVLLGAVLILVNRVVSVTILGIGLLNILTGIWLRRREGRSAAEAWRTGSIAGWSAFQRYGLVVSLAGLGAAAYLLVVGLADLRKDSPWMALLAFVGAAAGLLVGGAGLIGVLAIQLRKTGRGGSFAKWWLPSWDERENDQRDTHQE